MSSLVVLGLSVTSSMTILAKHTYTIASRMAWKAPIRVICSFTDDSQLLDTAPCK